jgi:hypothetical protein
LLRFSPLSATSKLVASTVSRVRFETCNLTSGGAVRDEARRFRIADLIDLNGFIGQPQSLSPVDGSYFG